jgi:sugar lactone lactonase YvrE
VLVAPSGDIFVTDSHRNGKNNRVVRFTKDGKFVKEWGKKGSGPGEISEPHTIAMDSRGRLFVGDRENNRIQIFDQDGKYLAEWRQFGRPSGISITADDTIYVTDSESGPDTGAHELMGIKKGVRIGSAKDRSGDGVHRGHGIDRGRSFGRRGDRRRCARQRLRRGRAAP